MNKRCGCCEASGVQLAQITHKTTRNNALNVRTVATETFASHRSTLAETLETIFEATSSAEEAESSLTCGFE